METMAVNETVGLQLIDYAITAIGLFCIFVYGINKKELKDLKEAFESSIKEARAAADKANREVKEVSIRDDNALDDEMHLIDKEWRENTKLSHAKMEGLYHRCDDDIKKLINDVGELKGKMSK